MLHKHKYQGVDIELQFKWLSGLGDIFGANPAAMQIDFGLGLRRGTGEFAQGNRAIRFQLQRNA